MIKSFLSIALVLICLAACKKETGVAGPAGPAGPAGASGGDTGAITGNLALYDEFGFPSPDSSGVIVTLTGGKSVVHDTTDSHGHYAFAGQSSGTYNLAFEKPDFGTMKFFGYSHAPGGGTNVSVSDIALSQIVNSTRPDSISSLPPVTFAVGFELYLDTPAAAYVQNGGNMALLLGKDDHVNISHNSLNFGAYLQADPTTGGYLTYIPTSILAQYFTPGDTMYVTGCSFTRLVHKYNNPAVLYDLGTSYYYTDPDSGQDIYPNIKYAPQVLKVVF